MRQRWRIGAALWVASALLLPVQLIVALQWPDGYSVTRNAISDLGVTVCGPFTEGGVVREVCSPWHVGFNAGMIASGVLTALGAVLLHGCWSSRTGRVATILMAVVGVCVVAVGFAPWDRLPALHDGAAAAQALVQWAAMLLLAVAAGRSVFRWLTIAAVAVSILGFAAFLLALDGAALPGLSFGVAERLSFDTLTVWTAAVGVAVLVGRGRQGDVKRRRLRPVHH
ncbi:DUF998 domain-containing protein [Brevibacterium sp. XM4083]|uniref:DUF998 domain-containing protein n=1 Tax=Brevibacterium sp. XM4083 TaxID=2583238 RepID=UPI00112DB716|nr:DUF998 domain-containing protein [Brevibacterium sp. XM4083]MCM1012246.1 DUF998 domain-containing protein [Brevibacterium sp. XM4083]